MCGYMLMLLFVFLVGVVCEWVKVTMGMSSFNHEVF